MLEIFEQLPGFVGWKDKNFSFQGCNVNNARALKFKHPREIIGLSDDDILDPSEACFHRKHDELALAGHIIKTIHASLVSANKISYFQIKKPLLDHNGISGILYHCIEFINQEYFFALREIDKAHCPAKFLPLFYETELNACNNQYALSIRELECLFCILRGMTAKQIAKFIQLSPRTVESYIEHIKNKLNCRSKSELIEVALKAGYLSFIPARFLQNGSNISAIS